MVIGIGKITFRLSFCHSLKEKRKVVKAIIRRTRNTFNVSMAEVGFKRCPPAGGNRVFHHRQRPPENKFKHRQNF
ncbi:MAG: DUF503 domain-containing protein [Desulfobacterales bacterium]